MSALYKTRSGRVLCYAHRTSGAPMFHTDGCQACEEARSKGIVRPDGKDLHRFRRGKSWYRNPVLFPGGWALGTRTVKPT